MSFNRIVCMNYALSHSCSLMSLCSVLFQHTIVVSVAFFSGGHAVLMIMTKLIDA